MGDPKVSPIGGKAWRQGVVQERQQLVLNLKAKGSPKDFDDAIGILGSLAKLAKRYEDPEDKPSVLHPGLYLDPDLTAEEETAAQQSLERVYEWLASTLEDSKLERHFRFGSDLTYPSSQFVALNTLDAAGFLKRHFGKRPFSENIWREKIREIEKARPYIKSLLYAPDAEPTTGDKVANLVLLGLIAIPMVAAAAVTVPEMIAAVGAASESALAAAGATSLYVTTIIPGGAAVFAFAVEHYIAAELVAYFTVGTIVNIGNAGGIEGFVQQVQTPEGAFQTAFDILFFVVQIRSQRPGGGGYIRVRTRVVNRSPQGLQVRVEHVEEVHPSPGSPPKLGKLYLRDARALPRPAMPGEEEIPPSTPQRLGQLDLRRIQRIGPRGLGSQGKPPEAVRMLTRKSIAGARAKFGRDTNTCDQHSEYHCNELKNMMASKENSSVGMEHCATTVVHDGKVYYIDSSVEQFCKTGRLDMNQVRALDAKLNLGLTEAINDGLFTFEQYRILDDLVNKRLRIP